MSDEKKGMIREGAEVVEGIVKAIPVYQDLAQPAVKEFGKGLQTVAKTIHVVLAPISGLVWGYEKISNYLEETLLKKLKDIPEERLITPNPSIAGPAIEALRFAGAEPSLRELYANLLATSIDSITAHDAHPAFVEIIKQLTPDEARIISLIPSDPDPLFPLITVRAELKTEGGTGHDVVRNFSLIGNEAGCVNPDLTPGYIDNLCRLGLVQIPEGFFYKTPGVYDPLEKHPFILEVLASIEKQDKRARILRKKLNVTKSWYSVL